MVGVWCLWVVRRSSRWGLGCFGGVWRGFFGRWCLLCGCSASLSLGMSKPPWDFSFGGFFFGVVGGGFVHFRLTALAYHIDAPLR